MAAMNGQVGEQPVLLLVLGQTDTCAVSIPIHCRFWAPPPCAYHGGDLLAVQHIRPRFILVPFFLSQHLTARLKLHKKIQWILMLQCFACHQRCSHKCADKNERMTGCVRKMGQRIFIVSDPIFCVQQQPYQCNEAALATLMQSGMASSIVHGLPVSQKLICSSEIAVCASSN